MAKVHNTCYKVAKTLTTAGKVAGFGLAATAFGAATLPMTVGGALQYYVRQPFYLPRGWML